MRDYGKIVPTFWTRGSGKALRDNPIARLAALYVMSAPSANMIGIYYLPLPTLAHELGVPLEAPSRGPLEGASGPPSGGPRGGLQGVRDVLDRLAEEGIAFYDDVEELVWVPRRGPPE